MTHYDIGSAQPPQRVAHSLKIIRHADVCRKLGISAASLFDMVAKGRFPKPFPIIPDGRSVGWIEAEVDAWIITRRAKVAEVSV
jgi:prophage regulatory protein